MTELVRVPLMGGGVIVAEVDREDIPGDAVVLAAGSGKAVAEAAETLDASLARVRPAIVEITRSLRAASPDSFTVEFGMRLGGEMGVIFAKGTTDVTFKVKMTWSSASPDELPSELVEGD